MAASLPRWRSSGILLAMAATLVLSTLPAAAQVPARFELRVDDAQVAKPLPADGTPVEVPLAWRLTCVQGGPAPESARPAQVPEVTLEGTGLPYHLVSVDGALSYPDCVLTQATQGQVKASIAAVPGGRGETVSRGTLVLVLPMQAPLPPVAAKADLDAAVAWADTLDVTVPVATATAGPQKEILFPVHLHLAGNSYAQVLFEIVGEVPPGWSPVTPVPVIIDPKDGDRTVMFLVSTPHENGENHASADLHLRVWATSAYDTALQTEAQEVPFQAEVRGLYVSGPSPALAVLAVAALAVLVRRARAA